MTKWNHIVKLESDIIRAITPETGTSTNAFVSVVDLDGRWLGESVITISNTAAVNELSYEVIVYNDYANGIGYTATTNIIAVSDSDQIILTRHARIVIKIKSNVADSHTTYQVDVIAGR